jgi:hypothetical protein
MRSPRGSSQRRSLVLLISASAHALLVVLLAQFDGSRPDPPGAAPLQVIWIRTPVLDRPAEPPPVLVDLGSPPETEADAPDPAASLATLPEPAPVTDTAFAPAEPTPPAMAGEDLDATEAAPERLADGGGAGAAVTWQMLEDTRSEVIAELRRERERGYRYLGRWRAEDPPLLSPAPDLFESATRERADLATTETDGTQLRWISDNCYSMARATDAGTPYVLRNMPASILCSGRANARSNLFRHLKPPYLQAMPSGRSNEVDSRD